MGGYDGRRTRPHERGLQSACWTDDAALSFGADPGIQRVSMHIDSIGLEEAVAEQDSAISELMSEALAAFERIRTGDMGVSGSKADPKDGDFHGDPSRPVAPRSATWALMASTPRIR